MWEPFVGRIRKREVIAFDLPGAGGSEPGRRPRRMKELAGVVTGLLDRTGLDRVDLLGYSLGGALAQEVAHRYPDRVARLVLAATTPGLPSLPPNPIAAALMLTPARYYDRRMAEAILPLIAGGRTARDKGIMRKNLDYRLIAPLSTTGYLHQLYSLWAWSSHLWLHRLPQPTLVLQGDEDPLVPVANARYMARVIKHGRLHIVQGAGHLFLLDQPDEAIAAIESFLCSPTGLSLRPG
jgi:pimeloyl-ACP methyl ester carboxylesterase